MKRCLATLPVVIISLVLWFVFTQNQISLAAEEYKRQTEIIVSYTQYEWWLIRWADNRVMCQVFTDHENLPSGVEVLEYCKNDIYEQWMNTNFCSQAASDDNTNLCQGLYMFFVASEPKKRAVTIDLPKAQAWVSLTGCPAIPLENRCPNIPMLLISGEEPLPNERIAAIKGAIGGEPFSCAAENCEIPLKVTSTQGVDVEFWAESSYGDTSDHYTAQVRVMDSGLSEDNQEPGWYVDILSPRWRGLEPIGSCAQCWEAFPSVGESPLWLSDPDKPESLASSNLYIYLAGQLISKGVVDAVECPNGGLLVNGWANACGLDRAHPSVDAWQNGFDQDIIDAARTSGVPAQLVKNIFAQESQFWPGALRDLEIQEFGLGHLTELGVDTVLLWNADFFGQFCPLVLSEKACEKGYVHLDDNERALLRGALTLVADTDCPACPAGINLTQSGFSIKLFTQTLQASCVQVKQIIKNITGRLAGDVAKYEDLWLFTLANYHAGPGCLYNAMELTWDDQKSLNWEIVSKNLEPGCNSAITFVENVTSPLLFIDKSHAQAEPGTQPPATAPATQVTEVASAAELTPTAERPSLDEGVATQATPTPTPTGVAQGLGDQEPTPAIETTP